jgi:hypothetical protein
MPINQPVQISINKPARQHTLLYPNADGALLPGAYASLGLGVDNAR